MKANQKFVRNDEAVSPVIGVILMVAITVVLAAVVFVLVTRLSGSGSQSTPVIGATADNTSAGRSVTITSAPPNLVWADFQTGGTAGCEDVSVKLGNVTAGDVIDCTGGTAGTFNLIYKPTNGIAFTHTFPA
jgi:flagellin-like protein